jgi:hypothetical protein
LVKIISEQTKRCVLYNINYNYIVLLLLFLGVEDAFSATSKVMTVSFHKYASGFFPGI